MGYGEAIRRYEAEVNALHRSVHEAYRQRDRSPAGRARWEAATQAFHEHRTLVSDLLDDCLEHGIEGDAERRLFAFDFIDCDPFFFRSGYALETLLRRMKALSLTDDEIGILRRLVLRRIDRGGRREFKCVCRLIPLIDGSVFREEIAARSRSDRPRLGQRALVAASYLPSHTGSVASGDGAP
ncbi:MAG: hypothetical protein AAFQ88_02615 [Pseudomonadota bacterium]